MLSKWARRTHFSICASAPSLFVFVFVQYRPVGASGGYYDAWRSEEREQRAYESCMICLWSAQRCSGDALSSSSEKPSRTYQSHNHSNCTTVISSVSRWANSWQRKNQHWLKHRKARSKPRIRSKREDEGRREQFRFPPLKEMKTRGAASGSLLTWFPKAKPHSARRVWTVHRPSSCMVDQPPVAPKAAFCFVFFVFLNLQGQKETREKRRCWLYFTLKTKKESATVSLFFIYNFMWRVKSVSPKGPITLRVLGDTAPRCRVYAQISGSFIKLMSPNGKEPDF